MISLLSILDVDENFKNLWKIVAFVLIVELENLWHSNVVVLAHGHLNEQVLCKTGKTHFITPPSLRQGLGWGQRWVKVREGVKGSLFITIVIQHLKKTVILLFQCNCV